MAAGRKTADPRIRPGSRSSILVSVLAPAQQTAAVGKAVPDFELPALIHGDGRRKLSEFFGSPVLFEFWGTR